MFDVASGRLPLVNRQRYVSDLLPQDEDAPREVAVGRVQTSYDKTGTDARQDSYASFINR
jgi:hypothetical protein